MVNRPKQIGTAAESLVVKWLRANGYPHAERRALAGNADLGDILVTRGLVVEVKAGAQCQRPGDAQLDAWCRQADAEATNAGAICLLVLARKGTRDVSRWWVVARGTWSGYTWRELGDVLHDAGVVPTHLQPEDVDQQTNPTPMPAALRSADH